MDDLGATLRAWRDRLAAPGDSTTRRAPGLRRQEVAERAGVSVGYLTRLEQGRASNPSPLVLQALARALELTAEQRELLFRLAHQQPPSGERMNRTITPGVQRLLDRMSDLPVTVYDAAWEPVAANELAIALLGPARGNLARRHFRGERGRVVRDAAETDRLEAELVGELHAAAARWPGDPELHALIDELKATSTRFRALWETRPAAVHAADRKTIDHPEVGAITLDCDVMHVHGSDLRIVVFSAAPGTPDALAVERLRVRAGAVAAVKRLDPLHLVG